MAPHHDNQLEARIDRALKSLPELAAPPTLIVRVMQAIARRQALPWFRRAWQTWPASWRVVSFALLAVLFGGLCFGAWELYDMGVPALTHKFAPTLSAAGSLWNAVTSVYGAIVTAIQHMNRNLLIGCLAAIGLGYAMCVALGTFCYALARNVHRLNNQ